MGRLLAIAAKSPDVDSFADALVAALRSTTLPTTASLDEMKLLLEQVPNCTALLDCSLLRPLHAACIVKVPAALQKVATWSAAGCCVMPCQSQRCSQRLFQILDSPGKQVGEMLILFGSV